MKPWRFWLKSSFHPFSRTISAKSSAIDHLLSYANIDKQLKPNQQAESEQQSTATNTPSEITARSTLSIETGTGSWLVKESCS